MKLLDPHRFNKFVQRHFGSPDEVVRRMVGKNRQNVSSYREILRFFGSEYVNPQAVIIVKYPVPFRIQDEIIKQFSSEIEGRLRTEGRLFYGPFATHIAEEYYSTDNPRLVIQPCDYALQAGSSFALDLEHPLFEKYGGTLRDYYFQKQQVSGVNPLPQCFGVCGFVVTKNRQGMSVLIVRRSASVASFEKSIGPSVAGSIDFPESVSTLANLLVDSLTSETEEELGIDRADISITPLAIARELYRGERPQLFGLIETGMTMDEVQDSVHQTGSSEIADCNAIRLVDSSLPNDEVTTFNPEAQMAWYLCEEYLDWRKS